MEARELLLDSAEYQHNTGSFASLDPFHASHDDHTPRRRNSTSSPSMSSPYYVFTSFLSRLRYRYLSLVAALPLPASWKGRSHALSPLPLHHISEAASTSLSAIALSQHAEQKQSAEDEEEDADMQALLKKV